MLVEPSLVLIMSDGKSFAFSDFVDQTDGNEVVFADGLGLGDCERIAADGFDGAPVTKSVWFVFGEILLCGNERLTRR